MHSKLRTLSHMEKDNVAVICTIDIPMTDNHSAPRTQNRAKTLACGEQVVSDRRPEHSRTVLRSALTSFSHVERIKAV